jgi:NAD(P)-dependent dehydrogenase (short-subunit alcohol dehydrogenase family)
MGKLDGKVAIVTGAGRGLGRAYAKRLAGLGAKIVVPTSISARTRSSRLRPRT